MKIEPAQQPSWGPSGKPLIDHPVSVTLEIPIFYATDRGPVPYHHSILCGKAFADTVLKECSRILQESNFALVHLGVYNPRKARRKDGTEIKPTRWSNHAYGEAMDFKGVITNNGEGDFLNIAAMKSKLPDKLKELRNACEHAITAIQRKSEIVDEGDWLHIGLWPLKK